MVWDSVRNGVCVGTPRVRRPGPPRVVNPFRALPASVLASVSSCPARLSPRRSAATGHTSTRHPAKMRLRIARPERFSCGMISARFFIGGWLWKGSVGGTRKIESFANRFSIDSDWRLFKVPARARSHSLRTVLRRERPPKARIPAGSIRGTSPGLPRGRVPDVLAPPIESRRRR